MNQLINLLVRYHKATNIPLEVENGAINLQKVFLEALNLGYIEEETYSIILNILEYS